MSKKPKYKKTVVIIGASSFVGSNIAEAFAKEYRVIGTYFNTPVKIPGVLMIKCDVLEKIVFNKYFIHLSQTLRSTVQD